MARAAPRPSVAADAARPAAAEALHPSVAADAALPAAVDRPLRHAVGLGAAAAATGRKQLRRDRIRDGQEGESKHQEEQGDQETHEGNGEENDKKEERGRTAAGSGHVVLLQATPCEAMYMCWDDASTPR